MRTRLFTFSGTVPKTEEKINEWYRRHEKYHVDNNRLTTLRFCIHSTSVGNEVFAITYQCDFE